MLATRNSNSAAPLEFVVRRVDIGLLRRRDGLLCLLDGKREETETLLVEGRLV